ncbi:thiamine pyrophosphate-dependent acetolactate synthase large subunit-like protein [Streptacidiphilus sp. BW17]|uniref:thiamine pyrophosphate-dependent enzyme n=1 Tax=Streptacidiphilus sp. BW17 TaxID=3156274 RepID=UPI003517CD68
MTNRDDIATAVLAAARAHHLPLLVGNGFLCREVMALTAPGEDRALPLQGGMGLAAGVAAGYALATNSTVIVLEGDGNHVMGWASAQLIGAQRLPVVHVVACNGVYRSTGSQPLSATTTDAAAAAACLGYAHAFTPATNAELTACLEQALTLEGPTLIYAAEQDGGRPPGRSPHRTSEYAAALARHAAPSKEARA